MFDPYHKWLGIPKKYRPPTFYQLLGIEPEETDPEVIEEAAIRQSTHLRVYQMGQHAELCTRLLEEVARAQATLLSPEKRKQYDALLRQQAQQASARRRQSLQPEEAVPSAFAGLSAPAEARETRSVDRRSTKSKERPGRRETSGSKTPLFLGIGGGVAALLLVVVVVLAMGGGTEEKPPKPAPGPRIAQRPEGNPPPPPPERGRPEGDVIPPPPEGGVEPPPPERGADPNEVRVPPGQAGTVKEAFRFDADRMSFAGDFLYRPEQNLLVLCGRALFKQDLKADKRVSFQRSDQGGGTTSLSFVRLSADGRYCYAVHLGIPIVHVYDFETGQERSSMRVEEGGIIQSMELLGDDRVAVLGRDRIRIVNPRTKTVLFESPPLPRGRFYRDMTSSPDGTSLWTVRFGSIEEWSTNPPRKVKEHPLSDFLVNCIAVSKKGMVALGGSTKDRGKGILLLSGGENQGRFLRAEKLIEEIAFSPEGNRVAAAGRDGPAGVWDVETEQLTHRFPAAPELIHRVRFTEDGRQVCTVNKDGLFQAWELPEEEGGAPAVVRLPEVELPPGKEPKRLTSMTGDEIRGVRYALTPEEDAFYAVGQTLVKHDLKTGRKIWTGESTNERISTGYASRSEDGSLVFVNLNQANEILIYDRDGKKRGSLGPHTDEVRSHRPHPDGRRLFSTDRHHFYIWDIATGKEIFRSPRLTHGADQSVLDLSGRKIYSPVKNRLEIWDVDGLRKERSILLSTSREHELAAVGDTVVLGYPGRVEFLDAASQERKTVQVTDRMTKPDLSPDGKLALFLTPGFEGYAEVWHVPTRRRLYRFSNEAERRNWRQARFIEGGDRAMLATYNGVEIWQLPDLDEVTAKLTPAPEPYKPKLLKTIPVDPQSITFAVHLLPEKDLLYAQSGKLVHRIDLRSDKTLRTYPRVEGKGRSPGNGSGIRMSEDGSKTFVLFPGAHELTIRDTARGEVLARLSLDNDDTINDFALLPKGERIAAASRKRFAVWEVATGKKVFESPDLQEGTIDVITASPHRQRVYLLGQNLGQVWDLDTRTSRNGDGRRLSIQHGAEPMSDGTIVSVGGSKGQGIGGISVLDPDLKLIRAVPVGAVATDISFSEDGKRALICGDHEYLGLWSTETWEELYRFPTESGHSIFRCALSMKEGKAYATTVYGVKVWQVRDANVVVRNPDPAPDPVEPPLNPEDPPATPDPKTEIVFKPKEVFSMETGVARDSADFCVIPQKNDIFVTSPALIKFDARTKKRLGVLLPPKSTTSRYQSFLIPSPRGERLYVCIQGDDEIHILDTDTGRNLGTVKRSVRSPTYGMALTEGGSQLLSVIYRRWYVTDLRTGKELYVSPESSSTYRSMDISPDGKTMVLVGYNQFELWSPSKRDRLASVPRPPNALQCMSLADDGTFAFAYGDSTNSSYRVAIRNESKRVREYIDLAGEPSSLDFTEDGKHLLIAGDQGRLELWEVGTKKVVAKMEGHKSRVIRAKISPKGTSVYSLDALGVLKIWDLRAKEEAR